MTYSTTVAPSRRRRQSRRQPSPEFKAGDALRITAKYQGSTHVIPARLKRIAVKDSTIGNVQIRTFVLEAWEPTHRSIVMSEAEFYERVQEGN